MDSDSRARFAQSRLTKSRSRRQFPLLLFATPRERANLLWSMPPTPVARDAIPIPDVPHKHFTLVLVRDYASERVLLGEKLRGFGAGYFNGFGGKVEQGESIIDAAARELREEANIEARDLTARGVLRFIFDDNPQPWLVHVFHASLFDGEIAPSDEMRPVWFDVNDVPFDKMWADDEHWYPLFMAERRFVGTFTFTQTTRLVSFHLRTEEDLASV